jgi:hypothetical protein
MNNLIICQPDTNIQLLLPFLENQLGSKLFQKCLYDNDRKCIPALFSAFLSNSEPKIIYVLNFLKEQFGREVLKQMLLFQNKQKMNILHLNVGPSNLNLRFLIELLKQELNKNEIRKLLLGKDVDGKNPLSITFGFELPYNDSNIRIMDKLYDEYVSILDNFLSLSCLQNNQRCHLQ